MPNITLSVSETIHADMKQFPEIRWSEVCRKAIVERVEFLKKIESITQKSKLTQADVDEFSKKINASATKQFLNEYHNRH